MVIVEEQAGGDEAVDLAFHIIGVGGQSIATS
jgi:hypothetical protein